MSEFDESFADRVGSDQSCERKKLYERGGSFDEVTRPIDFVRLGLVGRVRKYFVEADRVEVYLVGVMSGIVLFLSFYLVVVVMS